MGCETPLNSAWGRWDKFHDPISVVGFNSSLIFSLIISLWLVENSISRLTFSRDSSLVFLICSKMFFKVFSSIGEVLSLGRALAINNLWSLDQVLIKEKRDRDSTSCKELSSSIKVLEIFLGGVL